MEIVIDSQTAARLQAMGELLGELLSRSSVVPIVAALQREAEVGLGFPVLPIGSTVDFSAFASAVAAAQPILRRLNRG